jgi:Tol biopolymer transport system component
MPPSPGTRLGPYEIVAPLGAGGMGEVYRARDTRLGREVALKILPPAFTYDPARRARFEQEARAAAALNHPNIVGVHDLGEVDGAFYLVSELVPGETLDALMARGPLPLKKLLDVAAQVADGMAAAHAARITHRDLKPPNIMVTPEGRVKILDFGLAKQAPPLGGTANADATVTVAQTEAGMILGTVHYMSPEQARGAPADYRSDQFSFGLILYEMAAGRRAFDKPTTVQTMAAILSEDQPPIERDIPAPLRWTIERCLAKEPADRYESTRDLAFELRRLRDYLTQATSAATAAIPAAAAPAKSRRAPRWLIPAAAAAAIALGFAAGRYLPGSSVPDQSAYRFTPFAFDPGGQETGLWSPDGKAVAYAGDVLSPRPDQVFVRYLDQAAPIQITHLHEAAEPMAWAPDGRRIVFRRGGKPGGLWSVSVAGGDPQPFLAGDIPSIVAVSPDLKAVAIFRRGDDHRYSIFISSPVGAAFRKYEPDPVASHALYNNRMLRFSPDGKKLLVVFRGDRGRDEVWLLPYPSGKPKQVLTGKTFYSGTPMFSWLPDSRHVAMSFASYPNSPSQIWLADTGSNSWRALTNGTTNHGFLDVSPDGRKIVFTEYGGNYDIASVSLETGKARRIMATERDEYMPGWAAKQERMVYVTTRNGPQEIWVQGATDRGRPLVTARDFPSGTTQWLMSPDLSPDGERMMFTRMELTGGIHNWLSNVSGGAPVPLTNDSSSSEVAASWSPNGEYAVYLALHNGKVDLMKVQTTGEAAPVVVKADLQGDVNVPVWSPAGDWIVCGNTLYSPDGQKTKALGDHGTPTYAFSKDGKLLYGVRRDGDKELLFSLDVASGAEKVMGDLGTEFHPSLSFNPAMRFSLAPDGKSFAYTVGSNHSNLWMFEGFQ